MNYSSSRQNARHYTSQAEATTVPLTEFSVQDSIVTALDTGDSYQNLGILTGYQVKETPTDTLKDLISDARSIDQSLLAPWQKLHAVGTFLLPRLDFIMQGVHIEKGYLTMRRKCAMRRCLIWKVVDTRSITAELVL